MRRESIVRPYVVELRWELQRESRGWALDTSPTFPRGIAVRVLDHRVEDARSTRVVVVTRFTEDSRDGGFVPTWVGLLVTVRRGSRGYIGEWRVPHRRITIIGDDALTPTYDGTLEIELLAMPTLEFDRDRWVLHRGLEYPFVFRVHNHHDSERRIAFVYGAVELGVRTRKRWLVIPPRGSARLAVRVNPEVLGMCANCVVFAVHAEGDEQHSDMIMQGAVVR